ncbi:MAG: cytochrome c [Pseudomonadota bacterium]|nr:cytochrome c [Pseudomonadota bacterium]
MKLILGTIIAVALVAVLGGIAFIYSGRYDVAATRPHWPVVYTMLDTARIRSIKVHAAGITPPPDLESPARIVLGAGHFASHCALCHAAPGVAADDLAHGMYPRPPALTDARQRFTARELFWIVQHGIKMSGMPSWADHTDAELWGTVAFMRALPGMTPASYKALVAQADAAGGRHMPGMAMPGISNKE